MKTLSCAKCEPRAWRARSTDPDDREFVAQLRGVGTRTVGRGPSHRAFWDGLWRAIIYDRDNYTCYFCHRSGEEGVTIRKLGRLALRLQLDHINPRCQGGPDYSLSNIRTTCRLCNQGRFRLSEEHFRAELLSLANSVTAGPIRR